MRRLFLLFVLVFPSQVRGGQTAEPNPTFQVVFKSQSKLWLTGDSTLHPYSSTATVVNFQNSFQLLNVGTPQSFDQKLFQAKVLSFKVTIPVDSLKSGEKGLDKNLYKALKSDKFPNIEFRLTDEYLLANSPEDGSHKLTSAGVISIAGKENPVQLDLHFDIVPDGIRVYGTKHLLMTDYGVKPPTILAVIRTKNDITIHFDLMLAPDDGTP